MAYVFNADEILEMAIQIEENGAAFYRKAAELQKDASDQDFLQRLAVMEDSHKETFSDEKDSILFYLGLRDLVPPKFGREKIDDIIREERKHIVQLTYLLRKIKAK